MTWPDLVIGFIALLFGLKGWKRGFVAEIGGFIALAAAIWAAIHYPGTFDAFFRDVVHIGEGSAHVVGMVVFALAVYVALMVISSVLSRIAKLPVIGLGNGLGGALIGIAKSLVGVWVVLYVLLFFPLTRDIRADFHNSTLVGLVTAENPQIDGMLQATMPWFVRPLVAPLFARHRV
ncbi:MAG: CvpA family protein [Candidatus Eremiobacteraeota bacterium]|nr:CvpA family protein [Candidatus Eremiobacteraeota bacterium]